MDAVGAGRLDIRALDYMQPSEPKRKIRRMTVKSKIPGANEIRKSHAQGRRMAVPK